MSTARLGLAALAFALAAGSAQSQSVSNPHGATIGTCITCHRSTSWKPAVIAPSFRHAERTFPLDGAHERTACGACHKSLDFAKVATGCASCHADVHKGEFGTTCDRCHTARSFVDPSRMGRAHELTRFPLRGAHVAVACDACHSPSLPGQSQYRGRPTSCVSCHLGSVRQAKSPDHRSAGFSHDCAMCHDVSTWQSARYDHSTTAFPLVGAHRAVTCAGCHGDGVFKGKPTTCMSCHGPDYARAVVPPHAASVFPTTCLTCHTMEVWKGATFDHGQTLFALTGAHRAAACADCHASGVYRGLPSACVSCHRSAYDKSVTPPHASSGFPTSCESCHGTSAWKGAVFNHDATLFPLAGAHRAALCTACHGDGVYKGKSTACQSCHQKDYTAALLPPHSTLAFSTVCSTCHGVTTWAGGSFDHSTTLFPLTGAHRAALCSDCHADGRYRAKPTDCYACHQTNYVASKNPPHAAASFPTICVTCHTTTAWSPATFNHTTMTKFPLTGAHVPLACASCHGDGVYAGKPTLCVNCHQAKYDATSNPNHRAAGFPTDCVSCHTPTTWLGATFNHDALFFPIYSGKHQGKWTQCTDCHTVPASYALFVCTTCHLKTTMDDAHKGRSGYRYDSPTCYACHPRGNTP